MINESLTKCKMYNLILLFYSIGRFPFFGKSAKAGFFTSHIIFLISLFIYFFPYFSNFYALYIISFSFSLNHVE